MYKSPKIGTPFRGRSGLASGYYFGRPAFPVYALSALVFIQDTTCLPTHSRSPLDACLAPLLAIGIRVLAILRSAVEVDHARPLHGPNTRIKAWSRVTTLSHSGRQSPPLRALISPFFGPRAPGPVSCSVTSVTSHGNVVAQSRGTSPILSRRLVGSRGN